MPDDELNQNPPGEELEQSQAAEARVAELEGLLAEKGEEPGKAEAQIAELEQTVAEAEERFAKANNSLAEAVASYKALVIKSNPEMLTHLITGDTIDDINNSMETAKSLITRVREGLEAEGAMARVPAGAPLRTPPDLSALSPREKIQYAIGGKQ